MPHLLRRLALLSVLPLMLHAGEPPAQPMLRLETGGHTAPIMAIAVNGSGNLLATASNDKTLRLWDTGTGELVATLRPPQSGGWEGELRACAFSPDGATLAVGGYAGRGWDGADSVYLFDVASRALSGRIQGLPGTVLNLAYARDGRLAISMYASGIQVVRPDGRLAFQDRSYPTCLGADFDPAGRLVTSCVDGFVRLYDAGGSLLAKVQTRGRPQTVRFSPDGASVAVGFADAPRVELRSALDLALRATPNAFRANHNLPAVAWSADGATLYAAGMNQSKGERFVRAWSRSGLGAWTESAAGRNTVLALAALPDGRLAWAGSDADWGILDGVSGSGKRAVFLEMNLNLDPSGTRVSFAYERGGKHIATFDASTQDLVAGLSGGLHGPRTSAPGVAVADWSQRTTPLSSRKQPPTLNGRALAMEPNDGRSLSLAVAPREGFLLGTDHYLYSFDAQGERRWFKAVPGAAWAVNLSEDGALGAAALDDGTIRWYDMTLGRELLAFFPPMRPRPGGLRI